MLPEEWDEPGCANPLDGTLPLAGDELNPGVLPNPEDDGDAPKLGTDECDECEECDEPKPGAPDADGPKLDPDDGDEAKLDPDDGNEAKLPDDGDEPAPKLPPWAPS